LEAGIFINIFTAEEEPEILLRYDF